MAGELDSEGKAGRGGSVPFRASPDLLSFSVMLETEVSTGLEDGGESVKERGRSLGIVRDAFQSNATA